MRKTGTCAFIIIGWFVGCMCVQAEEGLVNYPGIVDRTLDNGLRVMLIEHHEQPTTSFHILIKAGRIDNPLNRPGLAGLTTLLLREGTMSRSSEQVTEQLAQMGAQFSVTSPARYKILKLGVLNQYAQPGLALFADMLLNPSFPGRELKRVKRDIINNLKLEQTYAQSIAVKHLRFLLFGPDHVLGRASTEGSIRRMRSSHVKAFYQKHVRPNNAMLLVIGDFESESMMARVQDRFGSWERADLDSDISTPSTFTGKGQIRVVHKPDATQAFIHLNHWALPCNHSDFYAYRLMNYILGGGGFSSRLMQSVRSQGGKTYGIRSTYSSNTDFGTINIQTATRSHECLSTYQLIQSVFRDLIENGITATELSKAQAYYAGSIPLQLETPDTIAHKVLTGALNGFTLEELPLEVSRLTQVEVSDVKRVIRTCLNPQSFNLVIVGNTKELADQLKQIGPFEKVHYQASLR